MSKKQKVEQPLPQPTEELAVIPQPQPHPLELMRHAQSVADVCRDIVQKTAIIIRGKKYVQVEGWQSIAAAHGFVAGVSRVDRIETGWNAIGELRSVRNGTLIATAEGFVGDDEKWGAEYSCRAKAQTRAMSRVCRSAFAYILVLIDKELQVTPADEMDESPQRPTTTTFKQPDTGNVRAAGIKALRSWLSSKSIPESFLLELCHIGNLADGSEETIDDLKDGVITRLNSNKMRDAIVDRWTKKQSGKTEDKTEDKSEGKTNSTKKWKRPMQLDTGHPPDAFIGFAGYETWQDVVIHRGIHKGVKLGDVNSTLLQGLIARWKAQKSKDTGGYHKDEFALDAALTLAAEEIK
jgi:hypothetical protein